MNKKLSGGELNRSLYETYSALAEHAVGMIVDRARDVVAARNSGKGRELDDAIEILEARVETLDRVLERAESARLALREERILGWVGEDEGERRFGEGGE